MTALHTIPEVCELTRMHALSANPEQWLTRQIKAGRFRARKVGRQGALLRFPVLPYPKRGEQ